MKAKKGDSSVKKAKRGMLKEAVSDLNKEISSIGKEKKLLNAQINNADRDLKNFKSFQAKLQKKIELLAKREDTLKEKRKQISDNEKRLSNKLSKIQKIKSELSEV